MEKVTNYYWTFCSNKLEINLYGNKKTSFVIDNKLLLSEQRYITKAPLPGFAKVNKLN